MSEIEKIERYTKRTKAPANRWALSMSEWLALASIASPLNAVALAYNYGKAKGYRAAKSGK